MNGIAAFIDVEHALDVVVIDSVAFLVLHDEIEGEIEPIMWAKRNGDTKSLSQPKGIVFYGLFP